jgi:type II secretory pathway pseudopilin PulG
MTLIELLVVIIILTTIVAAAIPIIAPSNDDRRLREATRGLNTFIMAAQARAIELQRPYGIALKKRSQDTGRNDPTEADNDNSACIEVFYVEQPPPYTGFDESSAAMAALDNGPNGGAGQVLVRFVRRGKDDSDDLPIGWDPDLLPTGVLRPGDVIEMGGNQFRFTDTDFDLNTGCYRPDSGEPDGTLVTVPVNDTGQMFDIKYDNLGNEVGAVLKPEVPFWTAPAPYKILRQPAYTSAEPYQLPEGTAIDLRASGVGTNDYFSVPGVHDNPYPVLIMFAPEGRISRVYFNRTPGNSGNPLPPFDQPVVDNVYLLVGRVESVPAPPAGDDPTLDASTVSAATTDLQRQEMREPINWLRDESRWIVLGPQSGRIVTIENAFVDLAPIANMTAKTSEERRNEQIRAARELTREMAQLGGR